MEKISISPVGDLLVYRCGYTPEFVNDTIRKMRLRGLRICVMLEKERLSDLNFLSEYGFLRVLDITSYVDYDMSCLSSLTNLRELTISQNGKATIDLSAMSLLEDLAIRWRKGRVVGLDRCCNVNDLCLIEYEENDIAPISELLNLNRLRLKTSTIRTVEGIQNFRRLQTLELGACRRLKSLGALRNLPNLRRINFDSCPNVDDISVLAGMEHLEEVELYNCKLVAGLDRVRTLPSLKVLFLSGNTRET